MKASIIFFPNTTKKSSRNAKIPLYARVIVNRTKAENRLVSEVPEADLLKWDPITMRFIDRTHVANFVLNGLDQKFVHFITFNSEKLHRLSARQILDQLLEQEVKPKTCIIEYVENYYTNAVSNNASITIGTKKNYRKAINHLKSFLSYRKTVNLEVSDLNNSLANEFKDYLLGNFPGKLSKGMTEPSAAGIVKKFRTIFDRAISEDLIAKNPFKTVKLKHRSPRRGRLSIDEIRRIIELDLDKLPAQQVYRDIFLFSIFTGLAYQDAQNLKYSHIEYLPEGEVKLNLERTKTGVQTTLFLVSKARGIIDKYRETVERKILDSVLPYRSNKEVNLQLKYLADLANIPMALTTHIARHTYRQLLAESGIEDMGVIKKMMGQTRNNDIDEIYYLVTDGRLLVAKQKLQRFLDESL